MEWKDIKEELLQDKKLREAYEKIDLAHSIGKMITDARITRRLTQQALAKLVGTKQPSIARIEKGSYLPSLSFLEKIAEALNTQLLPPRLALLENTKQHSFDPKEVYYLYPNTQRLGQLSPVRKPYSIEQRSDSHSYREDKEHFFTLPKEPAYAS
jgi:transcriptional regulator with XRE-family HTH domain